MFVRLGQFIDVNKIFVFLRFKVIKSGASIVLIFE